MDEPRKERLAINEALFRNVNEGIRAGAAGHRHAVRDPVRVRVDRLQPDARDRPALYEAVRANPRRFVLLDGHDIPAVERVVERHEGFEIVEKVGESGEIAETTDPVARTT